MPRSLFDDEKPSSFAGRLAPLLRTWAERGVFFGASSWKYPGWVGSVYSSDRYLTRNKFSKAKFEATCLKEYTETFPVVGGDFSFYQFPTPQFWSDLFAQTPPDFGFGLKVPETVTVKLWPGHVRYGQRAGKPNEHFLDATLFKSAFVELLEPHRNQVAAIIFEFGAFPRSEFASPDAFLEQLEPFLAGLPHGWRYAVEIRNRDFLCPKYFSVLSRHNVSHVFNAWTRMPTLAEQVAIPEAFTADFTVVRALLQKGRPYEEAVRLFEPYEAIKEPDLSTRSALRQIAERTVTKKKRAYMFVNNRLEGNAPKTIEAVATGVG